jgi:hypothetical protein
MLEIVSDKAPDDLLDEHGMVRVDINPHIESPYILPGRSYRSGIEMMKSFGAIRGILVYLAQVGFEGDIELRIGPGIVEHNGRVTVYSTQALTVFQYSWAHILDLARDISNYPMEPKGEMFIFTIKYRKRIVMKSRPKPAPSGRMLGT